MSKLRISVALLLVSEDQQARAVLSRAREHLVHQRTELVNTLRAVLYEIDNIVSQGIGHLKRIDGMLDGPKSGLHILVREECQDLMAGIGAKTKKVKELAEQTDMARRLKTMPGVGPMTALAIAAFAPDMTSFRRGRDFSAWLGLMPRQHSSGGKERLRRVSKAGQTDIRRLLIIGAMSRLNWMGRRLIPEGSWLAQIEVE